VPHREHWYDTAATGTERPTRSMAYPHVRNASTSSGSRLGHRRARTVRALKRRRPRRRSSASVMTSGATPHPRRATFLSMAPTRPSVSMLEVRALFVRGELGPGGGRTPAAGRHPGSTLIARAITRIATASDTTASIIMVIFAHVRRGKVSVGLNAVAFVKER